MIPIVILATMPSEGPIQEVAEALRQVAILAGCPADRVRVAMRKEGPTKPLEIEVRCAETEP